MDLAKSLQGMDEQRENKDTGFVFVRDSFSLPKVVGKTGLQGVGIGYHGTAMQRKAGHPS